MPTSTRSKTETAKTVRRQRGVQRKVDASDRPMRAGAGVVEPMRRIPCRKFFSQWPSF